MDTSVNGPESADGTLVIIVCRAKHLPNRRKLDKQSPYVTLRLGTTAKKTQSHFRGGQVPEWTTEIRFELSRERKPVIKLDVLDETKNDPTPIGTCDIDCSVIFAPTNKKDGKFIHDKWYDLTLNGRRAGVIYLEMTFYPSAPVLPPKLYDSQYEEMTGSFNSSTRSSRSLPPPPVHPSKSHTPTALDEVFVTGEAKRKGFFKTMSAGQIEEEPEDKPDKPAGKYVSKFNKLKNRFQAKDKISTLWSESPKSKSKPIQPLDVSEFDDLEDLERDVVFPHSPGRYYHGSDDEAPPSPPAHSYTSDHVTPATSPTKYNSPPGRKPPPEAEMRRNMARLNVSNDSTGVPFSADTIGAEDDDEVMPTKVYFMDKQVRSLSHKALPVVPKNMDEIDPRYHAPTPSEHFGRSQVHGGMSREKFMEGLGNSESGYLGDGRWDAKTKFSPSIFDRMPNDENLGFENKPYVPPKIPQGMTEKEYYVLEKEKYLRDINGRRA